MSMYALFFSASRSSRSRSGRSRPKRMPRALSTFLIASDASRLMRADALTASSNLLKHRSGHLDPVAGSIGVVDELVAQAQVEQSVLPLADPSGNRLNGGGVLSACAGA